MIEAKEDRIAALSQLGVLEHSCLAAEHCYTGASPEVLGHEATGAESEFVIVAAGLEKRPHLPEVSEPQEPPVGLGAVGVRRLLGTLSRARISAHHSHLLIRSSALSGRNRILLCGPKKV